MIFSRIQLSIFNENYTIVNHDDHSVVYTVIRDSDQSVILENVTLTDVHAFIATLETGPPLPRPNPERND